MRIRKRKVLVINEYRLDKDCIAILIKTTKLPVVFDNEYINIRNGHVSFGIEKV